MTEPHRLDGITDPVFGMELGPGVLLTHPSERCKGRGIPCCIHSPSDHHMRDFPMNWRADTQVMERRCPHGVGHPDPDHLAYVYSLTPEHDCPEGLNKFRAYADQVECPYPHLEWQSGHGCCREGCCIPPK